MNIAISVSKGEVMVSQESKKREPWSPPTDKINAYATVVTAAFTAVITIATIVNVYVAAKQWRELERNDTASSRAWIAPFSAYIYQLPDRVGIDVLYNNFGRDFAVNFKREINYAILPWHPSTLSDEERIGATAADTCFGRHVDSTGNIVFQTTTIVKQAGSNANRDLELLDLQRWNDPKNILLVTGCMQYATAGTLHHTAFCYYYHAGQSSQTALGYCNYGNAAD